MKVCHLTTVHSWNDVRIFEKECVSAAQAGYDVTIIALDAPEGVHQGVKVLTVSGQKSRRLSRMFNSVDRVLKKALEQDADIYHFHDPELLRISNRLLKAGKKVIYDAHEDVPRQLLDKTWIKPIFRKWLSTIFEHYENYQAQKLSAIIAATPHIENRFNKINSCVRNVNNFPVLSVIPHQPDWSKRTPTLAYIGGISITRGIFHLVESLPIHGYKLHLAGIYLPQSLRDELAVMDGWSYVTEAGYVNREGIAHILGSSKIGMVTLLPTKAYIDSLPIKMFEYMAAGMPVIASDFPLWREIIERHKCGICVDPQNPQAIADAVSYLMEHETEAIEMGENGRKASLEFYNWDNEAQKLIALYQSL
ncbi:MAG: glycosyltransferase family 4 protein [Bacteroidia bacterium]|jgi:glycosyltransferase involved in cell wall biosynthesis